MMRLVHTLCLMIALALPLQSVPASAAPRDGGKAVVDLIADQTRVAPGETFRAALSLTIDPGWHVYWKNPGDSGLSIEIRWEEGVEAEFGDFQWPAPHEQPFEGLMNYGYSDKLILPFSVTVPEDATGELFLSGIAQYLICEKICIPEDVQVFLSLPIADTGAPNPATEPDFAWADARRPVEFSGEAVIDRSEAPWRLSIAGEAISAALEGEVRSVRFFPLDNQIVHAADQSFTSGPDGLTVTLTEAEGFGETGPISGVLAITGPEGERYTLSLTAEPGDVLPGTYSDTPNSSSSGVITAPLNKLSAVSLITLLGAALIGGLILNLMPCVLPVLFIKARSILQLAGEADRGAIRRHGIFYFAGVVTCFLALGTVLALLRAGGEQIGLGFQLQYPGVVAALALLIFVIGLNMMGVFDMGGGLMGVGSKLAGAHGARGAFFTGVLAAFVGAPCVGPFIGAATGVVLTQSLPVILLAFFTLGVGMALPFALISVFPGLARYLPKPGPWMERLKQAFAFPLFLTAIWLLWVLSAQTGMEGVLILLIAATVIVFAIWLLTARPETGTMRTILTAAGAILLIAACALPVWRLITLEPPQAGSRASTSMLFGEAESWSPERVRKLQAEGRPIFIDFTASWCVTCQVNKRTTLMSGEVQTAFEAENVAFLVADWTRRDKVIGAELAKHGRAGVPLYLYYPAGAETPVILPQILSPELVTRTINAEIDGS